MCLDFGISIKLSNVIDYIQGVLLYHALQKKIFFTGGFY